MDIFGFSSKIKSRFVRIPFNLYSESVTNILETDFSFIKDHACLRGLSSVRVYGSSIIIDSDLFTLLT